MIRPAGGHIETIAGLGVWPRRLPRGHFMAAHGGRIPLGVERVVVPAAIDAWLTALERHGTMSFREVAHAAARHAREGFAVHPLLQESIALNIDGYRRWPSTAAIFLRNGEPPAIGSLFVQSDLASTFDVLFEAEARASGDRLAGLEAVRAAFYRGDIAQEIVRFVQAEGGFLDAEDMATFRSRIEPAVVADWRGGTLAVCGPWCQGPVLPMALRQLDGIDLAALGHNSTAYLHLLTEVLNNAFADRDYHFGDPAHVDVPLDALLSVVHARARAGQISPEQARIAMPEPLLSLAAGGQVPLGGDHPRPEPDTSYVAVIDAAGNAFSATPSDGSWTVPVVPGLGLVPSARGSQSRPDPDHPAGAVAGRRPRLTPNPALYLHGDSVLAFGTPGGDVQSQAMLQLLLNRFVFGMSLQEAIDAPRMATYNFPSSFSPFTRHEGLVKIEDRIDPAVTEGLAALGHRVSLWPAFDWRAGGLCAVETNPANGLILGGADPRRPAYAIGS